MITEDNELVGCPPRYIYIQNHPALITSPECDFEQRFNENLSQ